MANREAAKCRLARNFGIIAFLGALVLVASMQGCRSATTVTVLGEKLATTDAMIALLADFEAKNPSIHINFLTDDYATMDRKASDDLANQTAVYDVILQYNTALDSYVRNRYVYTLKELKSQEMAAQLGDITVAKRLEVSESDLLPNAWKEVGWYGNDAVGLPFATNSMLLCYNRELFESEAHRTAYKAAFKEELAPPKTWEQFERIAQYFSSQPKTHGVVLQGAAPYWIYFEWANLAYSMGGGVMKKQYGWQSDEQTRLTLTSPETVRATEMYQRLRRYNASTDFFSTDNYKQRDRMKQGDVAMAIMWSDVLYDLVRTSSGTFSTKFGFAPIPGDKSMLAGGSFYINRRSKHVAEAVQFVLWTLEPDTQARLIGKGLCSPSRAAYGTPAASQLPYAKALLQSLERGVYMLEAGPDADAIEVRLSNALQQLFKEKTEVRQVLSETERALEAARSDIFRHLHAISADRR